MKVFISQPMNGLTDDEILVERERAITLAKGMFPDETIKPIESFFEDYDPDNGCIPLKYLAKSLELLADADIAIFAPGYKNARGCRMEYKAAIEYGIKIIEL